MSPAKEAKCGERTTKANWLELPIGVTENILHRLSDIEILKSAHNVCRLWRNICKDPLILRTIDINNYYLLHHCSYRHLRKICCYAIESLELRECSHLDLSGSLRKRCLEQIKDLQLITYYSDPFFHADDCENPDSCGYSCWYSDF